MGRDYTIRGNEASPQPPSSAPSASESSLLGGRGAAAKTASKAHLRKTWSSWRRRP